MRIEFHHHDDRETIEILRRLEHKMSDLSDKVDALVAEVQAENDVITSGETLLTNISQMLKDALANGGNDPAQSARIQTVIDTIDAKKTEFAASIAANTPAAPAPPVEPPVTEPPVEPVTEPTT